MKKIIHLSDLHIGYPDMSRRFKCIVDNIKFLKQPASSYVIVITGDIVENAFDHSRYEEAQAFVEVLRHEGYVVLIIPGNHDYGTGWFALKKYVRRFKKTFFGDVKIRYPKLDIIEGVAFIGLDSMAEELNWYDSLAANGELGEAQLTKLSKLLARKAVKDCSHRVVYLHHHPFEPLSKVHELKDSEDLRAVLTERGNVTALLYGHNHHGNTRNGAWGIPRCYDGGTATRKDDGASLHRVIDLTRDARMDYDGAFHCAY